jgi:hemerythrin
MDFDALHLHLFDRIRHALLLPAGHFAPGLREQVCANEAGFRREEELMETFQCSDARLHREQHARMQAGLHHAAAALESGDTAPARRALAALNDWLPIHIETQDRHLLRAARAR